MDSHDDRSDHCLRSDPDPDARRSGNVVAMPMTYDDAPTVEEISRDWHRELQNNLRFYKHCLSRLSN